MAHPMYPTAPAIGSLVTAPMDRKPCYSGCDCYRNRGYCGIVTSVHRDIRTGRVLTLGVRWFNLDWTCVGSGPVVLSHVGPWSPTR